MKIIFCVLPLFSSAGLSLCNMIGMLFCVAFLNTTTLVFFYVHLIVQELPNQLQFQCLAAVGQFYSLYESETMIVYNETVRRASVLT